MPVSFETFLKHYSSWEIKHLGWTKSKVEYSWHSSIDWPSEFSEEVIDTFQTLKRRHYELVGKLGDRAT